MKKKTLDYIFIIITFVLVFFLLAAFFPIYAYAEESAVSENVFSDARIVISQCIIEDDGLKANENNKVVLKLKNTNIDYPVMSVLVTGQWVNNNVPVAFDVSNQTYVGTIAAGAEADAVFFINTGDINYSSIQNVECALRISYTLDGKKESVNTLNAIIPVYNDQKAPVESGAIEPVAKPREEGNTKIRQRTFIYLAGFLSCIIASVCIFLRKKMWN